MTVIWTVILAWLGIAVGSFLNVCIDRLPARKSLFSPPSHCDACQRRLSVLDMIPVFSYIFLRGRCRYCGAGIPSRVLVVEALTGIIFLAAYWRFGLSPEFGVTAFWSCVFLLIIYIDKEHHLILNRVIYPAAIIAVIILAVDTLFPGAGILPHLRVLGNADMIPVNALVSGLLAGAIFFVFFLIVFLINPRGLGMGDIKLAGLIGLTTGFPLVFVAMFIGIILGGVVAVILVVLRRKGRKDIMPYGVFLSLGPIITLLWGASIFQWYLG